MQLEEYKEYFQRRCRSIADGTLQRYRTQGMQRKRYTSLNREAAHACTLTVKTRANPLCRL
jgi:hypothetical protein